MKRGENSWTATVNAARSALGDSSPRGSGGRVVGDPVDQILGAVSGLGGEHERRHSDTLYSRVYKAARQAPAASVSQTAASAPSHEDEEAAARAKAKDILDGLSPAEQEAIGNLLDEETAALLTAEAEAEQASWEAAEKLPWEPVTGPPGYYSEAGQAYAQLQRDWHADFQPEDQPSDWQQWQDEFGEEDEAA